jgi:hypothetical protein
VLWGLSSYAGAATDVVPRNVDPKYLKLCRALAQAKETEKRQEEQATNGEHQAAGQEDTEELFEDDSHQAAGQEDTEELFEDDSLDAAVTIDKPKLKQAYEARKGKVSGFPLLPQQEVFPDRDKIV